jgi:hypothetical protein
VPPGNGVDLDQQHLASLLDPDDAMCFQLQLLSDRGFYEHLGSSCASFWLNNVGLPDLGVLASQFLWELKDLQGVHTLRRGATILSRNVPYMTQ